MVYMILKLFFDKKNTFYGMLFAAFLPINMSYGIIAYADSTLAFFIIASVYYALKNRIYLSSFSLSFAILTKYTGIVITPLLLYMIFKKNRKSFLKYWSLLLIIVALVSMPWYIRNWIYLKNPVYPVLNSLFHGVEIGTTFPSFDFSRLISINSVIFPFLEFFGVPDGHPSNIFFFKMPLMPVLLTIWLIATILFILPIFFGFKLKKGQRNMALIWLLSFLFMGVLHILNVGWSIGRRLIPVVTALAFFWGTGINNIIKKVIHKKFIFVNYSKSK